MAKPKVTKDPTIEQPLQDVNPIIVGVYPLVPLALIDSNPNQPRKLFDKVAHKELTASIQAQGMLQPLIVRPIEDGRYQIIAGERRWRAARETTLEDVPVIIKEISDEQQLTALALVENLQRQNLDPIEVAQSFGKLRDEGYSQADIAQLVSKTPAYVSQSMRLLEAAPVVADAVKTKAISAEDAVSIVREHKRGKGSQEALLGPVKASNVARRETVAAARRGRAAKESTVSKYDNKVDTNQEQAILKAIDSLGLSGVIGCLVKYCQGQTGKGWEGRVAALVAAEKALDKVK